MSDKKFDLKQVARERVLNGQYCLRSCRDIKRRKSAIWDRFDQVYDESEQPLEFVACRQCFSIYTYSRRLGTKSILSHNCDRTRVNYPGKQIRKRIENKYINGLGDLAEAVNSIENTETETEFVVEDDAAGTSASGYFTNEVDANANNTSSASSPPYARKTIKTSPTRNVRRAKGVASVADTKCHTCEVDFGNVPLLLMHQSFHGIRSPFQCSRCQLVYNNVYEFWGHISSCSHEDL